MFTTRNNIVIKSYFVEYQSARTKNKISVLNLVSQKMFLEDHITNMNPF